jgi:phage tail tape-measure protein
MQTEKIKSDIEKQDAQTNQIIIDTQSQTITALKDLVDTFTKQMEAGIPLSPRDHRARINQIDIVNDAQDEVGETANSEEAADIAQKLQTGQINPADIQ